MTGQEVIDLIGLDRAKSVNSKGKNLLESESIILNQLKEQNFEVDSVYFNTDENGNSFPAVFLKKVKTFDVETLQNVADIHKKIWNYKRVLFLYVYSETEIRIYNCSEKPLIKTKESIDFEKGLKNLEIYTYSDKKQLEELNKLFSRVAIDTGIIWTLPEAQFIRDKINLQKRVDEYLVKSFVNVTNALNEQGIDTEVVHKVILRSLFLLYLEDREAADKTFYSQFSENAESYFDILDDSDATYKLFEKLAYHFNGNVFSIEQSEKRLNYEQLNIIKLCFIRGREKFDSRQLFDDDWKQFRLFNFRIIQIELISEIYENFLAETERSTKEESGAYYTPPALVEFILNEKLPIKESDKEYSVKILDPSCGSGIFLVQSFNRIVKRFENANNIDKLTDFKTLVDLLKQNIFGIEINPQAIRVAAFSLYLALVDKLNPKDLWQKEAFQLPYLINDPKETNPKKQGYNLYLRDTISDLSNEINLKNFQLVVGNPPFGQLLSKAKDTEGKHTNLRSYCDKHKFAKEMVLPFLHKAIDFAPEGEIALIFNTKVLTNTSGTFQNFRKWLFQQCYVEKVFNFSILRKAPKSFGGQLFGDATGPVSIVYYKKEQENPSNTIAYYAPKTYVRSNIIEGLCIDSTDLKFLPREEFQKPDTKIWKVAIWGGMNDWELIKRLDNSKLNSIQKFTKKNNIKSGVGFRLLTQIKDEPKFSETLTELKYLDTDDITRYYTPDKMLKDVIKSIKTPKATNFYKDYYNVSDIDEIETLTAFRRLGSLEAFVNPHIVVKKGLEQNSVCASFIENKCSFRDGVYGFYTSEDNIEELHLLLSYFNSNLSSYFLFMTISSYGIEREQIMKNEYLSIPINLNDDQSLKIKNATKQVLSKFKSKSFLNNSFENKEVEIFIAKNIDRVIYESLNLGINEINLINDSLNYSVDLFHKQEKSHSLFPVLDDQTKEYAEIISSELNEFLEGEDLFANATVYPISPSSPLMMIKLTHASKKREITFSEENVESELKEIEKNALLEKRATNIYFRKKLNYSRNGEIYIIRPNQRRFWSKSMALEDASELILELLNGVHDEA